MEVQTVKEDRSGVFLAAVKADVGVCVGAAVSWYREVVRKQLKV